MLKRSQKSGTEIKEFYEKPCCPRRVLFVLDPLLGHITVKIRGTIFKELFECNGWTVEYVSRRPELNPDDQAEIRFKEEQIIEMSSGFQVVYLLKVPSIYLVKELRKRSRAKVVFDLTDALWKPFHRRQGWRDLEKILMNVDAVFSDNEYTSAYGRKYNRNVFIIPACTHVERFDEMRLITPTRQDDKVVIGWVGSTGTVAALAAIQEPLEILFARYPNLELRVLGCDATVLPHFENVRFTTLPNYDEDDMIREVLRMNIGVFPPPLDLEDYRIRGALKGLIYMTGGIPAVCQNEGDCRRVVQDGVTGMLASTTEEWMEKLEILIKSPTLRLEMGSRALEAVRDKHSLERVYEILEEALLAVISSPGYQKRKLPYPRRISEGILSLWRAWRY